MTPKNTTKLASIQALRFLAVLGVVLAHGGVFHVGVAGVDLFFVISGFIIYYVTRSRSDPVDFIAARIIRIFPLYWLALRVQGSKAFSDVLHSFAGTEVHANLWFTVQSLLLLPTVDSRGDPYGLLLVAWTLVYEMVFYWVVTIFLIVGAQLTSLRLLLIIAAGLSLSLLLPEGAWKLNLQYPGAGLIPLYVEFVLGVVVAERFCSGTLNVRTVLLLIALGTVAFWYFPETDRALKYGLPSAAILAAALRMEALGWRAVWPLVLLGDASYAIYLFHGYFYVVFDPYFPRVGLQFVALIITVIAAGSMVHIFVENPALLLLRSIIRRRAPPSPNKDLIRIDAKKP